MTDIPRRGVQRTAKLASIPIGVASRAAAGWGRRLVGGDGEEISAQLAARSAEQLFAVLGELKGGAMKFGQALSVFEAAVPEELAKPYREALTKLQAAAPPMPAADVHWMLPSSSAAGGATGSRSSTRRRRRPPASVRCTGRSGTTAVEVAVKVQYPGAEDALIADLRQLSRFSRLMQPLVPGMEIKPLIAELRERMIEELDYRQEADHQRAFAAEFAGDDRWSCPGSWPPRRGR